MRSPLLRQIERWFIPAIFVIGVAVSLYSHGGKRIREVLWSDGEGYYIYLPATFIYGDWECYAPKYDDGLHYIICCGKSPENKVQTRYTYGISILQAPFFLASHAYVSTFQGKGTAPPQDWRAKEGSGWDQALNERRYTQLRGYATGWSANYARGILIASMFYLSLGLWLVKETLKRWFDLPTALLTTVAIFFATNLFYYSTQESSMSHVYSFFLFAAFTYLLPRFLEKSNWKVTLLIGFVLGLILLIRPSNLVLVLLFVGFEVYSFPQIKVRIWELLKRYKEFLLIGLVIVLVILPQLWYWKQVFGSWITYSYGKEGFTYWNNPQVLKVLFSYQNGLFMYTPLMLLAMFGLIVSWRKKMLSAPVNVLIFAIATYTFASWWAWWFGGAFGHRCYVEYYALLAWPLGLVIQWAMQNKRIVIRLGMVGLLLVFAYVNLKMTALYQSPWDGPGWTWDSYVGVLNSVARFWQF